MKIALVLRAYRSKFDITLRELAKDMDVSAATLCRLEGGKPIDMSSYLKVTEWLFGNSRPEARR